MDPKPAQSVLSQPPESIADETASENRRVDKVSNESHVVGELTSLLEAQLEISKNEEKQLDLPDPTIQVQKLKTITAKVQRSMIGLNRKLDPRNNAEDISLKSHLGNLSSALREIDGIDLNAHNTFITHQAEKLKTAEGKIKTLEKNLEKSKLIRSLEELNGLRWEYTAKEERRAREMFADMWNTRQYELESHLMELARAETEYVDRMSKYEDMPAPQQGYRLEAISQRSQRLRAEELVTELKAQRAEWLQRLKEDYEEQLLESEESRFLAYLKINMKPGALEQWEQLYKLEAAWEAHKSMSMAGNDNLAE